MSLPNNTAAYQDCYDIMDRAAASERGIKIRVKSWEDGYYLRMRMHYSRSLLRMRSRDINQPEDPEYGASGYDHLHCRLKSEGGDWWLTIEPKMNLVKEIVEL